MKKTVNTLNVGDNLYVPRVSTIIKYEINEISKDQKGVKVGVADHYRYKIEHSDNNAAISTKVTFNNGNDIMLVRYDDALLELRKQQTEYLKKLQENADKALSTLNEFTSKYFNHEQS